MKNIAEMSMDELKTALFPDVLNTKFEGLTEIDSIEKLSEFSKELKVITPGLALEPGQIVEFVKFVGCTVDTSKGMEERSTLFARKEGDTGRRKGIYAIISVNGREAKLPIESLVNPVTITGVSGNDIANNNGRPFAELIAEYNKKTDVHFIPKGAPSIAEVYGWKGQKREVKAVLRGFAREVTATAPEAKKENKRATLTNLSAVWFSKNPV